LENVKFKRNVDEDLQLERGKEESRSSASVAFMVRKHACENKRDLIALMVRQACM
jgi:hypothetical protein